MVNPVFNLQGVKVVLRKFTESDINDNYISWLNNLDVMRFSNQRFLKHNLESSLQYLSSFDNTNNLFISIRRLSDDSPIVTMTAYISNNHRTADVGILIGDKAVWGLGYGQDAWNTLIKWLFDHNNIRKITAGTLACNHGMIKLIESSGMCYEATRKEQEIVNKQAIDILYYAKFHTT